MTGLSAALGDSDAFDRLVVVSVDRIANTARRVHGVLTRLEQGGRGLVSLEEEFDTGEGSGAAVPAIFAALSPTRSEPAVPGDGWSAEPLRRHGYAPATVIDVGVAAGTPALYEAFPDAYHVLVEPLAEFEPALQALVARNGGEYVLAAAGAERGTLTLNLPPHHYMASTLDAVQPLPGTTQREVPVVTLDELFEERGWLTPIGLKIDVEGAELAVIEGAERLLEHAEFVIAELSVAERFVGERPSSDFIAALRSHGLCASEIVDSTIWALGSYVDLLFDRRA